MIRNKNINARVTEKERLWLESEAHSAGCSLSDYFRLKLGLDVVEVEKRFHRIGKKKGKR